MGQKPKEVFDCCKREFSSELLKKVVIDARSNFSRLCRDCVSGNPVLHDVFIGNSTGGVMYEENIANPKTGEPIPFYDKASKKAAMRMANVKEAGDRVGGMRLDHTKRRTFFT